MANHTRENFGKKAEANFSNKVYKTRKKMERPFGNMKSRDGNEIHYKHLDLKKEGEILRFIAHNMKVYFIQDARAQAFTNFSILTK